MTTKKRDLSEVLTETLGPLSFGGFLRGARTMKDMTQADMARFLGISKSSLCDIERGRQFVSAALASKIARKCGLSEVLAVEASLMDQIRRAKLKMRVKVDPARAA